MVEDDRRVRRKTQALPDEVWPRLRRNPAWRRVVDDDEAAGPAAAADVLGDAVPVSVKRSCTSYTNGTSTWGAIATSAA
jgi:hypothetical protein